MQQLGDRLADPDGFDADDFDDDELDRLVDEAIESAMRAESIEELEGEIELFGMLDEHGGKPFGEAGRRIGSSCRTIVRTCYRE